MIPCWGSGRCQEGGTHSWPNRSWSHGGLCHGRRQGSCEGPGDVWVGRGSEYGGPTRWPSKSPFGLYGWAFHHYLVFDHGAQRSTTHVRQRWTWKASPRDRGGICWRFGWCQGTSCYLLSCFLGRNLGVLLQWGEIGSLEVVYLPCCVLCCCDLCVSIMEGQVNWDGMVGIMACKRVFIRDSIQCPFGGSPSFPD